MDNLYSDFAYDDAFRTMVVKCDELLIITRMNLMR